MFGFGSDGDDEDMIDENASCPVSLNWGNAPPRRAVNATNRPSPGSLLEVGDADGAAPGVGADDRTDLADDDLTGIHRA